MTVFNNMFSTHQIDALNKVTAWLLAGPGKPQVFRLFGYAGTGKSTIAKSIAAGMKGEVVYAAFTGKAAQVMASKGCTGATTIHKLIYRPDYGHGAFSGFRLNPNSRVASAALVIIDECSMVGEELARDLLSFGTPVLVLGDPAQLPPVKGAGFFTEAAPDVMLTEIHRQALGNPLVRLSMEVRNGQGLVLGTYGQSQVIGFGDLTDAMLLDADQILVGTNNWRTLQNAHIRRLLGREGPLPMLGDRLICLSNDTDLGISNGETFDVVQPPAVDGDAVTLCLKRCSETEGEEIEATISASEFENDKSGSGRSNFDEHQRFDFGYAITVHKAQGSQWGNVLILDESRAFRADGLRWLYTGITRAQERVTVVI